MEYCKKIKIPNSAIILEPNISCIIFPENDEIIETESDDDSWVDMKKIL
jgi:hypothetical protein